MRVGRLAIRVATPAMVRALLLLAVTFPVNPRSLFGQAEKMVAVPPAPAIVFTASVPAAPAEAQVYKLAPTPVPTAFLNEKLTAVKLPALKLEQKILVSSGATGQTAKDQARAFADPVSGDVHFIPNLTEMLYPDDGLQFGFGEDAAFGGDIHAAWFDEVAANDGNVGTYQSQHLNGNPQVHWDRASTMIDARNLGQSIYSVGAQTASSTLWNFWMGN